MSVASDRSLEEGSRQARGSTISNDPSRRASTTVPGRRQSVDVQSLANRNKNWAIAVSPYP
eukprot:3836933-Pyramimonas_sp.AAC.1